MADFEASDRLAALPQYLFPKTLITVLAGRVARSRSGWTRALIPRFIERYRVDMSEAAEPNPSQYACFNDFFVRALRDGARPIADAAFVSPVDGAVIHCGPLTGEGILQVKSHRYSARSLVGGDAALAAGLADGDAISLYLSPRDYHRIHMPCDGRLVAMIHVPGSLFSVNPATVRGVPDLFARNERVVCIFDSEHGRFVLVMVGATIVGSMATVWHGVVNPPRPGRIRRWDYGDQSIRLSRGDELGRFLLGSTVVMLFARGMLKTRADWLPGRPVRLGEAMAELAGSAPG